MHWIVQFEGVRQCHRRPCVFQIAHLSTAVTGCIAAAEQEVGGEVGGVADVSHVEARTAAAAGKAFAALPREEMLSQDSVSIAYDKEGGRFV